MDEKRALEKAACEYFLKTYNAQHGTSYRIKEQRDRPDFVVDAPSGEVLGIEVTHLYYDGKEAKMRLGRLSGELHGTMRIDGLISALNQLLESKATQASGYDFPDSLFLLVRIASPIFGSADFKMFGDDIHLPPVHRFEQIWLLFQDPTTHAWTDLVELM